MNKNDHLTEHFTFGELIKSATAERKAINNTPPAHFIPKLKYLCTEILEPIRTHYGIPFSPNSGYRSLELNTAIGGSPQSQHCEAEAIDIEVPSVSNYDLAVWIRDNLDFDKVILECYQQGIPRSGWVHVSLKEERNKNRAITLTYSNRTFREGLYS